MKCASGEQKVMTLTNSEETKKKKPQNFFILCFAALFETKYAHIGYLLLSKSYLQLDLVFNGTWRIDYA